MPDMNGSHLHLTTKVTLTNIIVIGLVIILTTWLSYRELYTQAINVSQKNIVTHTNILARDLAARLNQISNNSESLAQNTLVINALLDDYGRTAYLQDFLVDIVNIADFDVSIAMTDFQGKEIIHNRVAAYISLPTQLINNVIEAQKSRVFLLKSKEQIFFVQVVPIIYINTGSAEGALIYQLPLSDWTKIPEIAAIMDDANWIASIALNFDNRTYRLHGELDMQSLRTSLKHDSVLQNASLPDLSLSLMANPSIINQPLDRLLLNATLTGLAVFCLVAIGLWPLSRRQLRKIIRLKKETEQIKEDFYGENKISSDGVDEIDELAETFDSLLKLLNEKHRRLKQHESHLESLVSERTVELIISKDKAEVANRAKSEFLANTTKVDRISQEDDTSASP